MSQLGLSLGAGLAPRFAVYFAYHYSWHWTFYAVGILSLAWIPVWLVTARLIPPTVGRNRGRRAGILSACSRIPSSGR